MRREEMNRRGCSAYFTVEAALIMPIVLICYFFIMVLMCYIYERCVWEQNACRLFVWNEYVDGYSNMTSEIAEEISKEEICQYVLYCLNEEEALKYLFGQDVTAEISIRGESISVKRSMLYPQWGEKKYEILLSGMCLEPVEYIRTMKLMEEQIIKNGRKEDDNE